MNLNIDFYKDWIDCIKKILDSYGYEINPNIKSEDIAINYFNLKKRFVEATPRKIFTSKEFSCPDELKEGLELVKKKIKNGDNISPHLSKKITNLDFNDQILNDWGIHHLHLGTKIYKKGFVNRTNKILFVKFDKESAYLIDVKTHNSWEEQEIVRIIHKNWPELIKEYQVQGMNMKKGFTDDEIKKFRENGITAAVKMDDGTTYILLGGGYSTSKTSIEVVRIHDYVAKHIHKLEEHVKNNIKNFINAASAKGKNIGSNLDIHLEIKDGKNYIVERNSKIMFIDKEFRDWTLI